MRIIAFYTVNTPYADEVKKLISSGAALGLKVHATGLDTMNSWTANCAMKPEFILRELQDEVLLYLDSDAVIHRIPVLPEGNWDIAVHYRDNIELLSGTIIIKPSARDLIQQWVNKQTGMVWDQKVLQEVLEKNQHRVLRLPECWTHIFDKPKTEAPIITHNQASRRFKSLVSKRDVTGIRVDADGTFYLPRSNPKLEKELDRKYDRCPGELRWYRKGLTTRKINEIEHLFKDQVITIIGKGPSLDKIELHHIEGTCICINESIHRIESLGYKPLIMMQQDLALRDTCTPKYAIAVVTNNIRGWYPEAYIYSGNKPGCLTAEMAIILCRHFNAKRIRMLAFDSCINGSTTYAASIVRREKTGGKPERFLTHKAKFIKTAGTMPLEFIAI